MRLYTYQTEEKVKELLETGELKTVKEDYEHTVASWGDGRPGINTFKRVYRFMMNAMKDRLGECDDETVYYPVWAWYRYNGKRKPTKKHDEQIREEQLTNKEQLYRIDFEIDDDKVLLSDFELYCQLLDCCIVTTGDEDEIYGIGEFDKIQDEYYKLARLDPLGEGTKEEQEMYKKINSVIFNYNHKQSNDWYSSSHSNTVQGAMYKITKDMVIDIVKI